MLHGAADAAESYRACRCSPVRDGEVSSRAWTFSFPKLSIEHGSHQNVGQASTPSELTTSFSFSLSRSSFLHLVFWPAIASTVQTDDEWTRKFDSLSNICLKKQTKREKKNTDSNNKYKIRGQGNRVELASHLSFGPQYLWVNRWNKARWQEYSDQNVKEVERRHLNLAAIKSNFQR